MKAKHLLGLMAACGVVGSAQASEYEVQLGDKTYIVKDGEALSVVTPRGETLRLVVKRRPILTYSDADLTFDYSSDMKVSSTNELGGKTITVECENSSLFLAVIIPEKVSAAETVDSIIAGVRAEMSGLAATFPDDNLVEAKRTIGGVDRIGSKLRFTLGSLRHETEVFVFQKGSKTIALVFQADHEDRAVAEKYFKIISESIK